jgi:hypothetical protein
MSKVKIQGNASGTGIFTVAAPATNTDRTITLPDSAGVILTDTSTISTSNLSGTISTNSLSGKVLSANAPSGSIIRSLQWTYSSVYENTAQNVEYDLPGVLGDGSANITLNSPSNNILITAVMHCGHEDTWRVNLFKIYYSIGGGSWNTLTGGGFGSINYVSSNNTGCQSVSTTLLAVNWNTTSNIRFKVTQIGHANGGYLHLNQNNVTNTTAANNTVSVASSILLQEVQS